MDKIILSEKQYEQALQIAAEVGANTALDRIEIERQRESREMFDKRLHNTKLLLRNFRLFKAHVQNAVFDSAAEENPLQILRDMMMPGRSDSIIVESIKKSSARTATIVYHIEKMIRIYHAYCAESGRSDDVRRWRIIDALYISDHRQSISELAAAECVVDRTIYKDIDAACDTLAPLIFGIDGIKKR